MNKPYQLVIVGGGTAGWMFATAASHLYSAKQLQIILIESEQIGSVGVGEATLPQLQEFNKFVGIDEQDMMQKTNATVKLGIKFDDWGSIGNSYVHPFGQYGNKAKGNNIYQQWALANQDSAFLSLPQLSYAIQLCLNNKFELPAQDPNQIKSTYSYAYHFDATLYAQYLRSISEQFGVTRIEGMIQTVSNHVQSGDIKSVTLKDGQVISGDFFIDCSGFRSLLLGDNLQTEFEDWSKWLICDRAIAAPTEKLKTIPNYTLSTAKEAGWQWKIPLQHRTGNGYVYCSDMINEQAAMDSLLTNIEGKPLSDPKVLKFKAGRYAKTWNKNCVGIGLASGFLEPLESTSIYLIQTAITSFLRLFPLNNKEVIANEFNRNIDNEYDRIRDFLILHYHQNQRNDSELWRYCQNMSVPDSLKEKMTLFEQRGYIDTYKYGLFNHGSWLSVLHGQGLRPKEIDPFTRGMSALEIQKQLEEFAAEIEESVYKVPRHNIFLQNYCPAKVKE
ncbi:tryptophan halogenase family protein [Paraglaciecola hydrolytica]|uniref:Tryptophan halogenase n=1 Tax=Paraglaciecola hydrolytica TaxID=1799789 RepID=A0A136A0N5_9ALTE|nr:tryptophan halogenase family protein [Paraglaciecola hydrolytica]KXI28806.1 tryptophan halogenase [Paraglaciecola hydrolytica]